jgi:hypothetical protein
MEMYKVDSSNIAFIGWADSKMVVEFKNGSKYEYPGVDEKLFKCFLAAESKGKFFAQNIKKLECTQLGIEQYFVKAYKTIDSRLLSVMATSDKQALTRAKKKFKEEVCEPGEDIVFVVVEKK